MSNRDDGGHSVQHNQDLMWDYYQSEGISRFSLSYPRHLFLARLFKPGQRVLNVGVGSGYLEAILQKRGVDIYTMDPSEKAIANIRRKLSMGDKARKGHGDRMPFEAAFFDGIIMTEVLEHLSDEILEQTLTEVHRLLRPGGLFTGTVPYNENLKAHQVFCPSCQTVFHVSGHCQSFDRKKMSDLLIMKGFKIIKIQCRAFPDWRRVHPRLLLKSFARYILGRLGEPLVNPNIYFKTRKPQCS